MNKDVMGVQEVSPGYEFVAENPAVPVGYKQTDVGVIPEDWNPLSIVDFASIKTGPFGTLLKASEYSQGDGVPLISVGEVGTGKFRVSEHTPLVSEKVTSRLPQYVLKKGDIVFGRKGAVDRSALVTDREAGWFLGSDGISVRPDQRNDPAYLAYQFQRHEIQQWLLQNATGTTMASLNQRVLGRVSIPCPPKHEQRAIATALRDVDALLEELDRLITKKRDIKQAAMQQLLTGETRLPGFEGEWDSRSLLQIADSQKALFDDGDWVEAEHITDQGIRLVQTGNIGEGVFVDKATKKYIYDASFEKLRCKELKQGDILICRLAEPAGRACVFPDIGENRAITSVDVTIFRPRPEVADRQYLVQYLSTSDWFKMVLDHVGGTTHKRISRGALGKLKVPFPPIEEQKAIAKILSDMDTEIHALEQRRSKTAELKQGMMQELLTGRTRLV